VRALTSAASPVPAAEAEAIAAGRYGIVAPARRLAGEKDDNFAFDAGSGSYVLKIAHPDEPPQVTSLVTAALLALEGVPDVPVQRVVRTSDGEAEPVVHSADGRARRVRMTSYVEGRMLRTVPSSRPLRENLGRVLARMGQELRGFAHPAATRALLWDIAQADRVRPLLAELDGPAGRDLLVACLDRFDADLGPRLAPLRRQLVHNDLSGDNVVIGDDGITVAGVIDFGDALVTQLVNDVAVAATNLLAPDGDPFAPVLDFVCGYHAVEPLTASELELLPELVRLRIAIRIVITEWRSRRFPENRAYIMRNTPAAWRLLRRLPEPSAPDAARRLLAACGMDR
jgi:Ser/Thr protein kinase RdoA (MazF antagonist)